MKEDSYDVIFAGVGGMGALTAGQLLAQAAAKHFRYATYYPNITSSRRNEPADCVVRFSDKMIYSQLTDKVETAVIMSDMQMHSFDMVVNQLLIDRIKDGGLLIQEEGASTGNVDGKDIRIVKVPGIETSLKINNPRGVNIVYLGVYVGATKVIPIELARMEVEKRFGTKKDVLTMNIRAFEEGVGIGGMAF